MRRVWWGIALICLVPAGCLGVRAKRHPAAHAVADAFRRPWEAQRRDALEDFVLGQEGLRGLGPEAQQAALDSRPGAGPTLVLAERAYRQGLAWTGWSWGRALASYRDAAAYASIALDEPGALGSRAVEVHNASVERLVRLAWRGCDGKGGREALAKLGVATVANSALMDPARVDRIHVAGDFRVKRLSHHYETTGLGVPLVTQWENPADGRVSVQDRYYPTKVIAAATAVLRAGPPGSGGSWKGRSLTLTLHDPFEERVIGLAGGRSLAMAGDRSTAVAVQVERDRSLRNAAFGGALTSRLGRYEERLVMLRPHRPGRIPVVFVHGLASSPLIWAETLNELANDPSLADRYEFWHFLYATGEPIPKSAERLREDLAASRKDFDPAGTDPSLSKMVVVAHSQGGLLAKTLVQDSGLTLWNSALNVPYPASRISPKARESLAKGLVYQRDPGVRRLVFLATPHRGSPVADLSVVKLLSKLARTEPTIRENLRELREAYGRDSYEGGLRGDTLGLTNLRTDSAVLAGLQTIPLDPAVPHHTIALRLGLPTLNQTDGLVPYASAHLDTAASEVIVPGMHLEVGKPEVTNELKRILRLHRNE